MRFLSLPLLLALLLAACGPAEEPDAPATLAPQQPELPEAEGISFRPDGRLAFVNTGDTLTTIAIEVAASDSARQRGLMDRDGLPERSGMLFIFDREEPQGFWMADTPMSLDLAFVDADSQIVNIEKFARPFSQERVESDGPAQYVVEVPAGFADRYGLTSGQRVTWEVEDE